MLKVKRLRRLRNDDVMKKVEELKKAVREFEDFVSKTADIVDKFIGSIPPGTSLVYTWVKGNGGQYWYWYLKRSGVTLKGGETNDMLPMNPKGLRLMPPKSVASVNLNGRFFVHKRS